MLKPDRGKQVGHLVGKEISLSMKKKEEEKSYYFLIK